LSYSNTLTPRKLHKTIKIIAYTFIEKSLIIIQNLNISSKNVMREVIG
jgi:hypothetical protein